MINYKGFTIYHAGAAGWRVQSGYEWLGDYKTLGAAKSAITQKWEKQY